MSAILIKSYDIPLLYSTRYFVLWMVLLIASATLICILKKKIMEFKLPPLNLNIQGDGDFSYDDILSGIEKTRKIVK